MVRAPTLGRLDGGQRESEGIGGSECAAGQGLPRGGGNVTEQALDLRRLLHSLRRRWKWVLGLTAIGLSIGALATMLETPTYVAKSRVLLPPSALDAKGDPLRSMETEAHIATSTEILDRAGAIFTPPVPGANLRSRVDARGVSADILEVRVEAGRPPDARLLADAVAEEYVAYTNGVTALHADSTVGVLRAQVDDLQERIRQLESSIAAGVARLAGLDPRSPEAARQAALVDSMRMEQVDASRQLATANGRIADARLDAELSGRGTRVLQWADDSPGLARPRPAWNLGGGGLIGLLTGAVLAIALDRNDGRVRRRDDIAEAVGAPVVASLAVPRRGAVARCRALLHSWEPTVVESLVLRQAFDRLGIAVERPPVNLVVATLPGDRAGPVLALQLAASAAAMEIPTAFVVASDHPTNADLRSALVSRRNRQLRPHLSIHDLATREDDAGPGGAELSIVLVVAEGGQVAVPTWGRTTLTALVVSSGFASPEALAAVTLTLADAGHPVQGVLVANADPGDRTIGRMEGALPLRREVMGNGAVVHDFAASHGRGQASGDGPTGSVVGEAAP